MPKFAQQALNLPGSFERGRTQLRAETWVAVAVVWAVFCPRSCCGDTSCAPTLATGLGVSARGSPQWDFGWAARCRVSSFHEWAFNICSLFSAAESFLPVSDFWDLENGTGGGQDPEQCLPHLGSCYTEQIHFSSTPLGLHRGFCEFLSTTHYLHTRQVLLSSAHTGKLKIALPP